MIKAYHAVFDFTVSCVNKSESGAVVARRRRGRGMRADELFVEVDMVGDGIDLCDLQDHPDIAKRVRHAQIWKGDAMKMNTFFLMNLRPSLVKLGTREVLFFMVSCSHGQQSIMGSEHILFYFITSCSRFLLC